MASTDSRRGAREGFIGIKATEGIVYLKRDRRIDSDGVSSEEDFVNDDGNVDRNEWNWRSPSDSSRGQLGSRRRRTAGEVFERLD